MSRETCRETWLTKMEFAPPIWRDILWALSSDQIRKAWPCDLGYVLTQFGNLYHGFEKRGRANTRVTSTRLELDNKYREAKGMMHMTHCRGSSNEFTHTWELARSARSRYQLSTVVMSMCT